MGRRGRLWVWRALWLLIWMWEASCEKVTIDTCNIKAVTALRFVIQNEIMPLFTKHNLTLRNESFLHRIRSYATKNFSSEVGLLFQGHNAACSICGKVFSHPDYLALHYTLRHGHNHLNAPFFYRCPADLCSFFPCYHFLKSDSSHDVIHKRVIECNVSDLDFGRKQCSAYILDAIDLAHPNATQLWQEATGTICMSFTCDETLRKNALDSARPSPPLTATF